MNIFFLIGLIATITVALPYYFMVHIPKERLKEYRKKLGNRKDILKIIDNLRVDTCIEQVLIWESENGGGIAKFGNRLKVSVVEQSREQPFRDVFNDFQELEIYGNAIDIIHQVQTTGSTARFTHEMEECVFKRIYAEEGALWVEWFSIGPGSDKTFFYASVATSKPETPYQLHQGGKIEIAKNALRNKYKEMSRKPINWLSNNLYL